MHKTRQNRATVMLKLSAQITDQLAIRGRVRTINRIAPQIHEFLQQGRPPYLPLLQGSLPQHMTRFWFISDIALADLDNSEIRQNTTRPLLFYRKFPTCGILRNKMSQNSSIRS
jgi:hypothetical protein